MAKKTEDILRDAVKQIKAGKSVKARQPLIQLLRREADNAQAWYLLSFTLDDPQRQQYALLQALRVTPDFEKASARLSKLRGETIPVPTTPVFTEPVSEQQGESKVVPIPAFFEEEEEPPKDAFSFKESSVKKVATTPKRRSNLLAILLGIIMVGLLIFAVWIFLPNLTFIQPTVTPVASRTLPPTWTPSAVPASATPSNTPIPSATPTIELTATP